MSYSCELKAINETLVNVCNAIVSVINVDITVVDNELNRITGTGRYVKSIGEQLSRNCIFAYALQRGESFIIENPREHEACSSCNSVAKCKEFAQVCCPIIVDETIVGIMGLIAFDEKQKGIILENKTNLLDFLNRMSELIASKILENRKTRKVNLMARELEILLNSMDIGVISSDENGVVLRHNLIAEEMFNLNRETASVKNIIEIIEGVSIPEIRENRCHIHNNEFSYQCRGNSYRGYYNAKPIMIDDRVTGFIFTFNKINELIKVVNDISSSNMVITFEDIIGNSTSLETVKKYAKRISSGASTVLIQGESGTGKELFARAIHYTSDRRNKPFVAINCSAIPENLIESELFGYEEGAFTGARKGGKIGKFELANKGTIFLDEIGDMPLNLQTKLLRVLQENIIERVGGNTSIPVDVRIIAASNKLLEKKVMECEFREDLFYRLNVIPIHLPPLRARLEDIELLADAFLHKFNQKLYRSIEGIDLAVFELFKNYKWPGNVRELENVIEYSVNMSSDNLIKLVDLPRRLKETESSENIMSEITLIPLRDLEKNEIEKALRIYGTTNEGIENAAKALGISRATIYRKLKSYE